MGNVIGEEFEGYVAGQINVRQKIHGSGVDAERTIEQINYLNSKTAWVKLASGIRITEERAKANNFRGHGTTTAQSYILSGGVSRLKSINDKKLTQRSGIENNYTGAYNVSTKKTANPDSNLEFGLVPMPGIESVEVKNMNRGSLKKATIKIKAYSREQFEIIDALYLRLGYTMMLEWGNSLYIDNEGKHKSMGYTLIDSPKGWFNPDFAKTKSFIGRKIEGYRKAKNGNYDGLFSKVVNFDWSFESDGSYNITLHLISLGDVIESLKMNTTPSSDMVKFINEVGKTADFKEEEDVEEGEVTTEGKANSLTALLVLSKLARKQQTKNKSTLNYEISIAANNFKSNSPGLDHKYLGNFISLEKSIQNSKVVGSNIRLGSNEWASTVATAGAVSAVVGMSYIGKGDFATAKAIFKSSSTYKSSKIKDIKNGKFINFDDRDVKNRWKKKKLQWVIWWYEDWTNYDCYAILIGDPALDVEINGKAFKSKDIAFIDSNEEARPDGEATVISDSGFFIRFGKILEFIKDELMPTIEPSGRLQIGINSDMWDTRMAYYPNQISLDPRVCIVNADIKPVKSLTSKKAYGTLEAFPQLRPWRNEDEGYAWPMNIYLSFVKVIEIMNSNVNDEGDLSLFDFLSSICTELNKALGGVNNLEPVIDEENNIINIIDSSFSSNSNKTYGLEIFGYNPEFKSSNFVRDFGLKTAITKEYANMVTVGATAAGYAKGMEATAFSKWSHGYVDRFKTKIVPPQKSPPPSPNEAKNKYTDEFLYDEFNVYKRLGFKKERIEVTPTGFLNNYTISSLHMDDAIIDDNVAIVTEYYKWLNAETAKKTLNNSPDLRFASQTNGFIPMSLNLTLDGISGIKIYNQLHISARFLPNNYPDNLRFLVKAVNHSLNGQDWETKIETQTIPESMDGTVKASYDKLKEVMFEGTPIQPDIEADLLGQWQNVINNSIYSDFNTVPVPDFPDGILDTSNVKKGSNSPLVEPIGSTRALKLNSNLLGILSKSAYENQVTVHVTSGGQPSNPNENYSEERISDEGVKFIAKRTGSHRHDEPPGPEGRGKGGMAVDFHLKDAKTGVRIPTSNDKRWRSFAKSFKKYSNELGFKTSGGAGTQYMSNNGGSAHFDIAAGINIQYFNTGAKVKQAIWKNVKGGGGTLYPWVNELRGFSAPPTPPASGGSKGVILMTGVEKDKTHAQQEAIFKQGYSGTVYAYTFSTLGLSQLKKAMAKNPTFDVVLFSAGAKHAETISKSISNPANLYVVEPFTKVAIKTTAWKGVRYAVEQKGVPPTNIQTNDYPAAGYGVLLGKNNPAGKSKLLGVPSKSKILGGGPNNKYHFQALTQMGKRLNS